MLQFIVFQLQTHTFALIILISPALASHIRVPRLSRNISFEVNPESARIQLLAQY